MATFTNIGQSTPRLEGTEKVTGSTQYTADLTLPGTLWGRCLRSPWPHARILPIDASRARQVPGVHAVLTGGAQSATSTSTLSTINPPSTAFEADLSRR